MLRCSFRCFCSRSSLSSPSTAPSFASSRSTRCAAFIRSTETASLTLEMSRADSPILSCRSECVLWIVSSMFGIRLTIVSRSWETASTRFWSCCCSSSWARRACSVDRESCSAERESCSARASDSCLHSRCARARASACRSRPRMDASRCRSCSPQSSACRSRCLSCSLESSDCRSCCFSSCFMTTSWMQRSQEAVSRSMLFSRCSCRSSRRRRSHRADELRRSTSSRKLSVRALTASFRVRTWPFRNSKDCLAASSNSTLVVHSSASSSVSWLTRLAIFRSVPG
mmetsp:Transcript_43094/g.127737  ORF Transcript_43094/g.127737 Transcript_43094/m.127737 type:complete len:285 (+) Transcript_43094:333-1187(+)